MNNRTSSHSLVPLTPDLQLYKQHHKSKTRKKNNYPSIQPTQQPQPLHLQSIDQYDKSPKQYKCFHHPQKKAQYHIKTENGYKRLCSLCAFTLNNGGEKTILDNQKYEKKKQLDKFRQRVTSFKQILNERETKIYELLSEEEQNYNQYIQQLNDSFETILNDLDEKHQQMNSALCESIQKRRKSISSTFSKIEEIKDSVDRYIYDINKNYEDILQELSMENFRDVMHQYNVKIQYYNNEVLKKIEINESINVYFPIHEFQRILEKANISYFDRLLDQEIIERNAYRLDRNQSRSELKLKKKYRCETFKQNRIPNPNYSKWRKN